MFLFLFFELFYLLGGSCLCFSFWCPSRHDEKEGRWIQQTYTHIIIIIIILCIIDIYLIYYMFYLCFMYYIYLYYSYVCYTFIYVCWMLSSSQWAKWLETARFQDIKSINFLLRITGHRLWWLPRGWFRQSLMVFRVEQSPTIKQKHILR